MMDLKVFAYSLYTSLKLIFQRPEKKVTWPCLTMEQRWVILPGGGTRKIENATAYHHHSNHTRTDIIIIPILQLK